jgi:hypothetical protein
VRILHIDTGGEMRGGQHQVMLLLDGLRARGHSSLLLARENSPLWQAAKAAGQAVAPAVLPEVWKRSPAFEIVHAHDAKAHTLAAVGARRSFVVSRRVAFPIKETLLSRWKYSRPARYLAVSQFVAGELRKAGVRDDKIAVVYDAVPAQAFPEDWNPMSPVVALRSTDPGKLAALAAESAALAEVRVEYAADLPASLRRASLFLYLSSSEGLGSGALLAMSMGVPVIASRIEGLAEVFEDGSSGIYVRNDAREVAAAIRKVLDDRETALRLRAGGLARIAERFTAQKMVSDTLLVYESALA